MVVGATIKRRVIERLTVTKTIFYTLITLLLLGLFGLKDILILLSQEWPHLYAVTDNPVLSWEEVVVYLPLARSFSLTTPLPAAPMAEPSLSQFTNFPPLLLILQGGLLHWLFSGQIDGYLLVMHSMLPTAAFWVLFLIYRRYVAESWSLMLAFWGVTFFRNFSSLGYWLDLLKGGGWIESASLSPPELTRTPTPALSFLLFILTFYLTTRDMKPDRNKMLFYSCLWALHLYIYLFNFIAGILFWFGYLIFVCYLRDKALSPGRIIGTLLANGGIVLIVISPFLLKQLLASPLDREMFERMGLMVATAGPITSEWGFLLAYVLPLAVVLFVAWISSADYYELIYRFAPVFLMILVEIVVLNLHLILGQFFQPYLFSVRIGNFFSRYLYFIPVIYFISLPRKTHFHHRSRLSHIINPIYLGSVDLIVRWRRFIALLGVGLIAVVVIASGLKYANHHITQVAPHMVTTADRFNQLTRLSPPSSLVVSEDITVNLLLPVLSQRQTLLVSSFNNYVPEETILERLLLFAHLFHWSQEQFLDFMMPGPIFTAFYSDNDFVLSPEAFQSGFGYWLLNHRRQMNGAQLAAYKTMLIEQFAQFDVQAGVAAYGVTAVQSSSSLNPLLTVSEISLEGNMIVYQLEE